MLSFWSARGDHGYNHDDDDRWGIEWLGAEAHDQNATTMWEETASKENAAAEGDKLGSARHRECSGNAAVRTRRATLVC